ncbi:class I SAM-dependent methyltransferase [Stackebrandtia nassauensis]|uniref:Methyltransferase type 11 n=1 Tax=Stackebrandtia nassauensis (strain DSM 44728 / CIP 108903 / NRRL B-16338 / NBRC 102104 / LLR-40K-21) TaxID=446470 RepID=D3Q2M9_STANL|nr:methyltransferase domain-containing protein [Stackebrandtia nassauensis]ADD45780.1 Methyltransferase type 11 [Stackebrandtia nassauensis DSM 44728]
MDDATKLRWLSRLFFSGPMGRMSASAMEKRNSDAEAEAVATLDPSPSESVLAIGFGPGVGIRLLAERLPEGQIGGIDPSAYMVKRATRRNRAAAARIRLERAYTAAIPWPDASFDGAIAVNSIQFWNPLADNASEVARVLRPGARLVTFTHDWALARGGQTLEGWQTTAEATFRDCGFTDVESHPGKSEDGHIVAFCATRSPS